MLTFTPTNIKNDSVSELWGSRLQDQIHSAVHIVELHVITVLMECEHVMEHSTVHDSDDGGV